jgi:hypothetical protein
MLIKEASMCGVETPSLGGSDSNMLAPFHALGKKQFPVFGV